MADSNYDDRVDAGSNPTLFVLSKLHRRPQISITANISVTRGDAMGHLYPKLDFCALDKHSVTHYVF